ncbi:protein kinase [bacterium]|nr:protein kinase [candidate division CSSED10-310 bacterium]
MTTAKRFDILDLATECTIDGNYTIKQRIGVGGMGVVYRIEDRDGDEYAVKFLTDKAASGTLRFKREFRMLASMQHESIVRVLRYGEWHGYPYFIMEYVDGLPLHKYLEKLHPLLESSNTRMTYMERVLSLFRQICLALAHIHMHRVLHRDLKPENVMITHGRLVKLMDFGIARPAWPSLEITDPGLFVGSYSYFSPEQAQQLPLDARSDLYSTGVMLFEALTGQPLYETDNHFQTMMQIIQKQVPDPRQFNPDVPESLCRLLREMLAKNPADRPRSALEVVTRLEEVMAAVHGLSGQVDSVHVGGGFMTPGLVGRERELGRFHDVLSSMNTSMVFVHGESGIGTSTLFRELNRSLAERQGDWLRGVAICHTSYPYPFGPLIDLFKTLCLDFKRRETALLSDSLVRHMDDVIAFLNRRRRAYDGHDEEDDHAAADFVQFQEVATNMVKGVLDFHPLLLGIDDLHLADEQTLNFLRLLFFTIFDSSDAAYPLVFLATYSDEGKEDNPGFQKFLSTLPGGWSVLDLHPERLSMEQVRELIGLILTVDQVDEDLLRWIFNRSRGVPGAIQHLLGVLKETGALVFDDDHWSFEPDKVPVKEAEPDQTDAAYLARLKTFSRSQRRLLQLLAVYGSNCPLELLKDLAKTTDERFLSALDELLVADVLTDASDVIDTTMNLGFTQTHFKELVYNSIDPDKRAQLHDYIARFIRVNAARTSIEPEPIIAYHLLRGTDHRQAIPYLLAAGDHALQRFETEAAVDLYNKSVATLEQQRELEPRDMERICAVLAKLGELYQDLGHQEDALQVFLKWKDYAERLGVVPEIVACGYQIGIIYGLQGRFDQAFNVLQTTLEQCGQDAVASIMKCRAGLGFIHALKGENGTAMKMFTDILEWTKSSHDYDLASECFVSVGMVYRENGQPDQALSCLDKALLWQRQSNAHRVMARTLNLKAIILSDCGQYDEAEHTLEEFVATSREHGFIAGMRLGLMNLGILRIYRGHYALAQQNLESYLKYCRSDGNLKHEAIVLGNLAELTLAKGEPGKAREIAEEGWRIAKQIQDYSVLVAIAEILGRIYYLTGHLSACLVIVDEALKIIGATHNRLQESSLRAIRGIALLEAGHITQGLETLDTAIQTAIGTGNMVELLAATIDRSFAALETGQDTRDILSHLQHLHETKGNIPNVHLQMKLAALLGLLLVSEGDDCRGMAMLDRAMELARSRGALLSEASVWYCRIMAAVKGCLDLDAAELNAACQHMVRLGSPVLQWRLEVLRAVDSARHHNRKQQQVHIEAAEEMLWVVRGSLETDDRADLPVTEQIRTLFDSLSR